MKSSIILLCLLSVVGRAQTFSTVKVDSVSKRIEFAEVVQADSLKKDELYSRAREWFAKTFKSADHVLQMDDREAGKLIGKGFADLDFSTKMTVIKIKMYFTLTISIKDGKYRYVFSDIYYKGYPNSYDLSPAETPAEEVITDEALAKKKNFPVQHKKFVRYREKTLAAINLLSEDLKKAMKSKPGDGW